MAARTKSNEGIVISPPNMKMLLFHIRGTAPYVQLRFSQKAQEEMRAKHEAGSTSRAKRGVREPRDFERDYEQAFHRSMEGWFGIPASAFRNAMISACRLTGLAMTRAKLAVFVEADGFDDVDGIPLIQIQGTPERTEMMVRNATGVADIRVRPMWRQWSAVVRVRFDADVLDENSVANLLWRVGVQVGIGEGRPDGKASAGMGWGLFEICNPEESNE